jgi:hypothetical protein
MGIQEHRIVNPNLANKQNVMLHKIGDSFLVTSITAVRVVGIAMKKTAKAL